MVAVGNSIGGSCAIEVARFAPTKVTALVLFWSKPGHRREPDAQDEALQVLTQEGLAVAWQQYWRPLFGPQASPDIVERAWRVATAQGADAIATGVRAFHGRPDRESFIRSWQRPVFIASGEHDISIERRRRLALELPNATFTRVDGVGHYVPLEAPDALTAATTHALAAA